MKKKLSERKRRSLIKEESKAAKEYRSYGLTSIARDEARHARALRRKKP